MTVSIGNNPEPQASDNSIVSTGGKLPLYQELKTSKLLNILILISGQPEKYDRKRVNQWLFNKTRPGFYMEINEHLHLAYADQRDGHGSQHWWRLFFDNHYKQKIEKATKSNALVVSQKSSDNNTANSPHNGYKEWGGMYFRSQSEIVIAEELDKRNILFFGNARGRLNDQDMPASNTTGAMSGRVEVDFLVFSQGKCLVLEVDGQHHQEDSQTTRDYVRDRILLREGIPTARFTAEECFNSPSDVVTEFLKLF